MSGHGHVTPNPDGTKARCGGPMACSPCAMEWAVKRDKEDAQLAIDHPGVPPFFAREGGTAEDYAAIVEARRLVDGVSAKLAGLGSPIVWVVACVTAHERAAAARTTEILETAQGPEDAAG
jgi:hypothetical protein